jgi:hypothetical protein
MTGSMAARRLKLLKDYRYSLGERARVPRPRQVFIALVAGASYVDAKSNAPIGELSCAWYWSISKFGPNDCMSFHHEMDALLVGAPLGLGVLIALGHVARGYEPSQCDKFATAGLKEPDVSAGCVHRASGNHR